MTHAFLCLYKHMLSVNVLTTSSIRFYQTVSPIPFHLQEDLRGYGCTTHESAAYVHYLFTSLYVHFRSIYVEIEGIFLSL